MNNFKRDLEFSLNEDFHPFYYQYFNNIKQIEILEHKIYQDAGIDKFIELESGEVYLIEEKRRRTKYKDMALEYISNDNKGSPGWIKKISADLLFYYLPGSMIVADAQNLKTWFTQNESSLLKKYPLAKAQNKTYTSLSVCVPINVLLCTELVEVYNYKID